MVARQIPSPVEENFQGRMQPTPPGTAIEMGSFVAGPCRAMAWDHLLRPYADAIRRHPDRPAVICGDRVLDYATLESRSNQLARHLVDLRVHRNDVVGIVLPRGIELIIAVLAVMKAGAAYMILDLHNPRARNAAIIANTDVDVVVSTSALRGSIPREVTLCLVDVEHDRLALKSSTRVALDADGDSLAYVINTSG
ncbi:MAG: AMP-binding protein, partial [Hyphomicrobiaceae bacterium]